MIKFFTYKKDDLIYEKFNFFKLKYFVYFFVCQIFISLILLIFLSIFFTTPKEKILKKDVTYLLNEFKTVNIRIIQSEMILEQIKENDSIIYKSIFDSPEDTKKGFDAFYDDNISNDYSSIIEHTNKQLMLLEDLSAKELYSLISLEKISKLNTDMLAHLPAIQPIDNKNLKRVASGWGFRKHPIYRILKFHYGLDFTAPIGTNIYATADGVIEYSISEKDPASKGYGNVVIINHGYGYKTLYAHMLKFVVKNEQPIKRGELIGYIGSTGLSTGPHLHYEISKNGTKINPINYLFNSLNADEYQKMIELSNSKHKSYD